MSRGRVAGRHCGGHREDSVLAPIPWSQSHTCQRPESCRAPGRREEGRGLCSGPSALLGTLPSLPLSLLQGVRGFSVLGTRAQSGLLPSRDRDVLPPWLSHLLSGSRFRGNKCDGWRPAGPGRWAGGSMLSVVGPWEGVTMMEKGPAGCRAGRPLRELRGDAGAPLLGTPWRQPVRSGWVWDLF